MKKILSAALILAVFTVNKKANAQQGFSVSVRNIPLFSFLQNKDDGDNCSIHQKATANVNPGIVAGYTFTPTLAAGMNVLYSGQGQHYKINRIKTNQRVDNFKNPVYFTYNYNPYKPVSFIGKIGPQLSVLTDSMFTDDNGDTLKSKPDTKYVRGQRP